MQDVEQLLREGAYGRADTEATAILSRTAASVDAATLNAVVEARLHAGRAAESETLALAQRALEGSQVDGRGDALARSFRNLGLVWLDRGRFRDAEHALNRSLEVARVTLGAGPAVAETLERLAEAMVLLEQLDQASKLVAEAVAIRTTTPNTADGTLARTRMIEASVHRAAGDYAAAVRAIEAALELRRRAGPRHPDGVQILQLHGEILFLTGEVGRAQQTWDSARVLAEQTLGPRHPTLAGVLRLLAFATDAQGSRDEAKRLLDQAQRVGSESLHRCHPEATWLLNDQAVSRGRDYNFAEARRLYEQTIALVEECGGNVDAVATAIFNLAGVVAETGDLQEARRLYERAARDWSNALGPAHPFVADAIEALADATAADGQRAEARRLYEQVLAQRRSSTKLNEPQIASTLVRLARVVLDSGGIASAQDYADRAIAIYRASGAARAPDDLPMALELRATIARRQRRLTQARQDISEALAERTRVFGPNHPLAAESRAHLSSILLAQGDPGDALANALTAERSTRDHIRTTVRYLPERQALAFVDRRARSLDLALSSVAPTSASGMKDVFEATVEARGMVLDELIARGRSAAIGGADSTPTVEITRARQRVANLLVRSLEDTSALTTLASAQRELERSERTMAERSAGRRADEHHSSIAFEEVRQALPKGSVLVSFVQYARSGAARRAGTSPIPSLAAFVVRPEFATPRMLRLGSVEQIDGLAAAWRAVTAVPPAATGAAQSTANRKSREAGLRLRRAVWDPLAPHVGAAERVLVVPDGALSLVPLAALPTDEGSYLLEQAPPIHVLSAERDLVRDAGRVRAEGLLAVGGPAYDVPSQAAPAPLGATLRSADVGCLTPSSLAFTPLDGTLAEVQGLAGLWSSGQRGSARVLVGANATEAALKREAPKHRVLHLATHGFFLGHCAPQATTTLRTTRGVGGLSSSAGAATNPLRLSGLALAGANRRASATLDGDDGILTAEEVAGLDLSGVEWAVLSACDTGVGEIRAGEGVFGLRRAFQVAGARTVIMSLWSVDDQATRSWMTALYEGRFQRKLSTADAVHQASLTVLRDRRARGLSTHPFYWAAFVAAGDWR